MTILEAFAEKQKAGYISEWGKNAPFWKRHSIMDHIYLEEITDDAEVIGPLTAIVHYHHLKKQKQYTESDKLRDEYHILDLEDGYMALRKDW